MLSGFVSLHPAPSAYFPEGGTSRMAHIPSWHMAGRPLCLLAGLFRGRQLFRPLSAERRVLRFLCLCGAVSAAFYHPDFVC